MKSKWLFIGDSITDSGRKKDSEDLGYGYVRMIRDQIADRSNLQIVNKGVSGNRIPDLKKRWKEDVMDLHPDVLSISIGINDVWRQLDNPDMTQVYPEQFVGIYEMLLNEANQINAEIVLMEPTIIGEEIRSEGNQKLLPYVEIVRKLAKKYHAMLVPTHAVFLDHLESYEEILTTDGVHMTDAGNRLLATTWLETCNPKLRS